MSILAALSKHRTKVLAGAQITCGTLIAELPRVQANMAPVHYGLVMIGLGVSTAILGFVNTSIISTQVSQGAAAALDAAGVKLPVAQAAMADAGLKPSPPPAA